MMRVCVFFVFVLVPLVCGAACPDGQTAYLGPVQDGYAKNFNGQCVPLCNSGMTMINTSVGAAYPLFAQKNTSPALHVQAGDNVCYADLVSGDGSGINIAYDGNIYHTNVFAECPVSYNLSYSCGSSAFGTPPDASVVAWGDLFAPPGNRGYCVRPSFVFGGWKIDNTTYSPNTYYGYLFKSDKTAVPIWNSASYGIAYTCGNCDMPYVLGSATSYLSATSEKSVTVSGSAPAGCANYLNAQLQGYKIQYADGTDTGDTVAAGGTFTYKYDDNIRLSPIWGNLGTRNVYNVSYSCGTGATGTAPDGRAVDYMGLFFPGSDYGTCKRSGYYASGWKIDSTSFSSSGYGTYSYNANKTISVNWVPVPTPSYAAAYVCNNGSTNSSYLSVRTGSSYTPSTTVCTAPADKVFAGYEIQYADGASTGDSVASGASFTFNYDDNIRLSALWE